MIKFPLRIPEYQLKTNEWTEREFSTQGDFLSFINGQWKQPGQYNLERTDLWRQPALKFQKDKIYTELPENSQDYKDWWKFEKKKTKDGVIFNLGDREFYVSGDYYWYLNYTPIVDKVKGKEDFAEVWDGDYHFYLYVLRAQLLGLNSAVVKCRQRGYEQPNSELVLTENHWKPIGDLKAGEKVFTPKGTLSNITDVFPQGLKDVYEIEFLDGRKVRCGINHLWTVLDKKRGRKKNEPLTISLEEIIKKGYTYDVTASLKSGEKKKYKGYRYAVQEIEPIQWEKKDLKIPPYVLGCLLGDGSFTKWSTTNHIRLCSNDTEIFDNVQVELGEDYEYGSPDLQSNSTVVRMAIKYKKRFSEDNKSYKNYKNGVNPLIRAINHYGLDKTNTYSKFIPFDYLHSNIEDRLELLKGLMDTDGYVNEKGYDIHFTSTSIQLAQDVLYLTRSLGLNSSISTFPPAESTHHEYYRVRIKNKLPLFKLKRKLSRQRLDRERFDSIPIINIKKLDYQEESTCISIDSPEQLYLTTDFVPTHNTLKHVSICEKQLWFVSQSVSKILGYEEDFVSEKGAWKFVVGFRNHLNEHTPWYRNFEPDEHMNLEQKQTVLEGDVYLKKKFKGLRSKLTAATTKKNPGKSIGGHINVLYHEESGFAPNLDKVIEYAEAATKMGGVKTGMIYVSGSVGELKECKPLEGIAFAPTDNGFLGVEDVFSDSPQGQICFFVPDYWNYFAFDQEKGLIKCYDEDGNSDIELAKEYLAKEEIVQRKKGEEKYRLWKSQHPFNLQDAFAVREENPFPVDLIKEHQTFLIQTYKPLTVELKREANKIKHHFIEGYPVKTLKIDPNKDNRGCIEIYELPVPNPPWGLYYAGVDPIASKNTSTSKSLQSVTIYKAIHYVGEKLVMDYPVAQYTGRHPKWEDTYRISLDLIKFYNTRTCVENNITSFIEWMIKEGESKWLMRRKEVTMVNEFVPTSSIRDEIGVRMEGELKKKALEFIQSYVDEIIGTEFEEDGTPHYIYGVTRFKDPMLLEEMLKFAPRVNTDRLISVMLALMAARSNTNRNMIVETKPYDHTPNKEKKLIIPSQFTTRPQQQRLILPNQFRKR